MLTQKCVSCNYGEILYGKLPVFGFVTPRELFLRIFARQYDAPVSIFMYFCVRSKSILDAFNFVVSTAGRAFVMEFIHIGALRRAFHKLLLSFLCENRKQTHYVRQMEVL
jgi:hypothetical protein